MITCADRIRRLDWLQSCTRETLNRCNRVSSNFRHQLGQTGHDWTHLCLCNHLMKPSRNSRRQMLQVGQTLGFQRSCNLNEHSQTKAAGKHDLGGTVRLPQTVKLLTSVRTGAGLALCVRIVILSCDATCARQSFGRSSGPARPFDGVTDAKLSSHPRRKVHVKSSMPAFCDTRDDPYISSPVKTTCELDWIRCLV